MAGQGQRDAAIALKDTMGKAADDITSKAADFQGVTADAAVDGAHAMQATNNDVTSSLDGLGQDAPTASNVNPDEGAPAPAPSGGPTPTGSVDDNFQDSQALNSSQAGDDAQSTSAGSDASSDDPVDLVTGEMFLGQSDVFLPGVLALELTRRHLSGYRHGQLFGTTWSSTLDQRVELDEDGIHFALADGRVLHYAVPTVHGQRVMPSAGARWPLSWDRAQDRDEIRVEMGDVGHTLCFAPGATPGQSRPLTAIVDRNGNRVTFVHDGAGVITDVYHSGGYHIVVGTRETRGGVRVESLRLADPEGGASTSLAAFRYDPAGRLVETIDSGSVPLVFEYDEADRITRWKDRLGYEYEYFYREDGRVVRVAGSDGFLDSEFEYDLAARTTTMIDALGNRSTYRWDTRGRLAETVNPLDARTQTEQDRWGNLVRGTDPLGRVTVIERDELGDPVATVRPDGSRISVAYNDLRLPVRVQGADGGIWLHEYDERGNAVSATDPAGARTVYEYDEHGGLRAYTDALGVTTRVQCDRAGLPVEVTDPLGNATRFHRDRFGRVKTATDALGGQTTYGWDHAGRPTLRRLPDGSEERWSYDAEGNLSTLTDLSGGVTTFEYGPFDRVVARTDPDGRRFAYGYDAMLHLTTVTAPNGLEWTYEYDAAGHVVAETDFNGARRTYELDAVGRQVRSTNALGQTIDIERDALGRIVTQSFGETVRSFTYDAAGNLVRAEAPESVLDITYDPRGRLLTESHNGRVLENTYDEAGQRVVRTTPSELVSRWTYDDAGRAAALSTTCGALEFSYDVLGQEIRRAFGTVAALTQSFDPAGRLTAQAIWSYDEPEGAWHSTQTRNFALRPDGLPTGVDEQIGGARGYSLDAVGRPTGVRSERGEEFYAYDGLGNLTQSTEPHEVQGTRIHRTARSTYEYDEVGRVVRRVLRTLSGQRREWTYSWDADDRLIEVADPQGRTWRYTYDAFGRRVAKTLLGDAPDQVWYWYTWDGTRLAEQVRTTAAGRIETMTWDYEPGTHTPAAQTRRSWAAGADQADVDAEFRAIVTDLVGTPRELVSPDGRVTTVGGTTLWGEPVDAAVTPLGFPGQYWDEETGLAYNLHRYYNPDTAAYLSPDPLGLLPAPNPHGYVENPLGWLDPLGLAPDPTPPTYVTYTKTHPVTGKVYTGRSRGTGTPQQIVANRDSDHHMNDKGYGPAVLDQSAQGTLPVEQRHDDPAYQAMRGREQQGIEANGGAQSMGGTSGNAINGIAPDNPARDTYMNAATNKFGSV